MRFGVEIEVAGLDYDEVKYFLCRDHGAFQRSEFAPLTVFGKDWNIVKDVSIARINASQGMEVVTPILQLEDLPALFQLLSVIESMGGICHKTCSIHVHVDGCGFNAKTLLSLQKNFINSQDRIYKHFGHLGIDESKNKKHSKKLPLEYARKLNSFTNPTLKQLEELWYNELGTGYPVKAIKSNMSRYYGLNLHSFFCTLGTVEFRLFPSTLDKGEVTEIINFCLDFCQQALHDIPVEKEG